MILSVIIDSHKFFCESRLYSYNVYLPIFVKKAKKQYIGRGSALQLMKAVKPLICVIVSFGRHPGTCRCRGKSARSEKTLLKTSGKIASVIRHRRKGKFHEENSLKRWHPSRLFPFSPKSVQERETNTPTTNCNLLASILSMSGNHNSQLNTPSKHLHPRYCSFSAYA
jgi:hypothetical protein